MEGAIITRNLLIWAGGDLCLGGLRFCHCILPKVALNGIVTANRVVSCNLGSNRVTERLHGKVGRFRVRDGGEDFS